MLRMRSQLLIPLFILIAGLTWLGTTGPAEAQFCWKNTYSRGVGTIPNSCGAGREYDAGLCYAKCRQGYNGSGPVCWQKCPSGFTNTGGHCLKPAPLTRGRGYGRKSKCENKFGKGNCVKNGALWYRRCPAGYHKKALLWCSPDCPSGMRDIGVSCQKKSYGRGVGTVSNRCPSGHSKEAGLCYPGCKTGYKGVGPICWGKCPEGYESCGAGCVKKGQSCRGIITEQVVSSLKMIANIATFMTSSAATNITAEQLDKMVNDALYEAAQNLGKEFLSELGKAAKDAGVELKDGTYESLEQLLKDVGGRINIDWSQIDTTGIYDLVKAFAHKICKPEGSDDQSVPPKPIMVDLKLHNASGEICPKRMVLRGYIRYSGHPVGAFNAPVTARYRIIQYRGNSKQHVDFVSQTEEVLNNDSGKMMRVVYINMPVQLSPGKHTFRLEVLGSDLTDQETTVVTCPSNFEVLSAKLQFTPAHQPWCPQKVKIRTEFRTNGPGTVHFRWERQGGPSSAWYSRQAKLYGKRYKVILEEEQKVGEINQMRRVTARKGPDKPGQFVHSPWRRFKTRCLKISDAAIYMDGRTRGRCSYRSKLRVRFNTNMPALVPYRVECSNGRAWDGLVHARRTAPGVFIAVQSPKLRIDRTGKVLCALKSMITGKPKRLAWRAQDYRCTNSAGPGGPSDVTTPSLPPTGSPALPPVTVACPVGTIRRGDRCVRVSDPPRLRCLGGRVHQGRCVCRGGYEAKRIRKNSYRCVQQLTCINGRANGNVCRCPHGLKRQTLGPNRYKCIRKTQRLTCIGGKVVGRRCACPRGMKPKIFAPKAFRCVRTSRAR